MKEKIISCDKEIHESLKKFCSVYEIKRLDKGIEKLIEIAYD